MSDPLVTQALSVSGFIMVIKAIITYSRAMGWWNLTDEAEAATVTFIDAVIPIAAVWIGVLWAKRRTTSLTEPRDVDGTPLTRPDNAPAIPEMEKLQKEAVKINEKIDERRIQR